MKKVVIVTRRLIMGGIEKALISMVEAMPKEDYDITIMVMGLGGELLEDVPKNAKVLSLYGEERTMLERFVNRLKEGHILQAVKLVYYHYQAKKASTVFEQEMYHSKLLPVYDSEFYLAIAYHTPASFPVVYVMNNIKARKKVAWIHSDVSQYKEELKPYKEYYDRYDSIFCVSKYACDKFIEMFPKFKEKTSIFYNTINYQKLKMMAEKNSGFNDDFKGTRILTVGRLTEEKGQDLIAPALNELLKAGHDIRWYLIGNGDYEAKINGLVKEYGLEEHLILLGTQKNPYPYFKQCDLYVQPSRHEGYCITLAEARFFNKPIITTDFIGAREQLVPGKTGSIVDFNENALYKEITLLLRNENIRDSYKGNLMRIKVQDNKNLIKLLE
jgi:glycosyltransferase involved in cell wall biosynthesis